eukprot:3203899-Rhodomonas_salina.3
MKCVRPEPRGDDVQKVPSTPFGVRQQEESRSLLVIFWVLFYELVLFATNVQISKGKFEVLNPRTPP